ncbi:MAG: hypothetical protein GWN58_02970, partial [Anaerolineae bacterium]|nr:hypothetical protein [Anaerolineae bacterium]
MENAVAYTLKASEAAIARANYREALAQLEAGLETIKSLPEGNKRAVLELELMVALSWVVRIGQGPAHQRCQTVLERAYALCREVGEPEHLSQILFGLSFMNLWRGNLREALDEAERLIVITEQVTDRGTRMVAEGVLAQTYWHLGRNIEAQAHYERLDELYDARIDTRQRYAFSVFHIRAEAAEMRLSLGLPDQARAYAEASLALARATKDKVMMGMAFFHLMPIHVWRGDPERVIQLADEFVAMKENTDLWLMDEPIGLFKLWALASCGKICGAAKQMAKALEF